MISIIIITLNEEKYLGRLLDSIKKQDFKDYEIIVSDAKSKDRTREIAKSYGCTIVDGGLPSDGRNNGAKAAKGDVFIFIDADSMLPEKFLEKNVYEFRQRKLAAAACYVTPVEKDAFYYFVMGIFNFLMSLVQYFRPYGIGYCIFSTRAAFEKIGGFDKSIRLAEDVDFVRRAAKIGKFRMVRSRRILASMRRFEKEGKFRLLAKYIYLGIYDIFFGRIKKQIVKYDTGDF